MRKKPPIPSKNPNEYHHPELLGAQTAMSLLNIPPIKANGEIMPCHIPLKKPYLCPTRHSLTCSESAQPEAINTIVQRARRINNLFFIVVDFGRIYYNLIVD